MTAQPADRIPASGPDTGPYEVIHLGGQAAVVVPVSDFLRLRALEQAASAQEPDEPQMVETAAANCPHRPLWPGACDPRRIGVRACPAAITSRGLRFCWPTRRPKPRTCCGAA